MKRQRGRGRKPGGNPGNRPHESNGPDVKIRGTAAQIYDKYVQYARDAHSSGDRVKYESFLQHAEHYFRIMAATMPRDRLQAAQEAGGGFGGASGGGPDEREHDDAPGSGLKVMDDASDDEGQEAGEGEGQEDFEEFEAGSDDRGQDRGEEQGRGRRRRGRRRRNEPGDRGDRGNGHGQDTEARSALDALAQRQAAVAGN